MESFSVSGPHESSRVSQLRAVFEKTSPKPGEPIHLTKGQSSTSGPRQTDHLAPTNSPPPSQSPKSAACIKTAEQTHTTVVTRLQMPPLETTLNVHEEMTLTLKPRHQETTEVIKLTIPLQVELASVHHEMHITVDLPAPPPKATPTSDAKPDAEMKPAAGARQTSQEPAAGGIQTVATTDEASDTQESKDADKVSSGEEIQGTESETEEVKSSKADDWKGDLVDSLGIEDKTLNEEQSEKISHALSNMMTDMQAKAEATGGEIPTEMIGDAQNILNLMDGIESAPWFHSLDDGLRTGLQEMHQFLGAKTQEAEEKVLARVSEGGRFSGVPKSYQNIRTSVFNWGNNTEQLAKHKSELLKEKDDDKIEIRQKAIETTQKAILASFTLLSADLKLLTEDMQNFKEWGFDKSHPEAFQALSSFYEEVQQLVAPDGELQAPSKQVAMEWSMKHFESSPRAISQEAQSKMQALFGGNMLKQNTAIDLSQLVFVTNNLKLLIPEKTEKIDSFQKLCENYSNLVLATNTKLKSAQGAEDKKAILENAKKEGEALRAEAQKLSVGLPEQKELLQRLSKGDPDLGYDNAQVQSLGSLGARVAEFIGQINDALKTS